MARDDGDGAALRSRAGLGACALLAALLALSSCASVKFERETPSSGTFVSKGFAFTLFSVDIPRSAMAMARENASDSNLPNLVVTDSKQTPYLGRFDWILDIISVRFARVEGTWGYDSE